MHLRFDGTFGFPGGLLEPEEDVIDGLNREMAEEIGWNPMVRPITWADYYSTQVWGMFMGVRVSKSKNR